MLRKLYCFPDVDRNKTEHCCTMSFNDLDCYDYRVKSELSLIFLSCNSAWPAVLIWYFLYFSCCRRLHVDPRKEECSQWVVPVTTWMRATPFSSWIGWHVWHNTTSIPKELLAGSVSWHDTIVFCLWAQISVTEEVEVDALWNVARFQNINIVIRMILWGYEHEARHRCSMLPLHQSGCESSTSQRILLVVPFLIPYLILDDQSRNPFSFDTKTMLSLVSTVWINDCSKVTNIIAHLSCTDLVRAKVVEQHAPALILRQSCTYLCATLSLSRSTKQSAVAAIPGEKQNSCGMLSSTFYLEPHIINN